MISQRPARGVSTRAAKHAGLSKRGQHSQSIEPLRLTSAAVWQSPMRPYSSILGAAEEIAGAGSDTQLARPVRAAACIVRAPTSATGSDLDLHGADIASGVTGRCIAGTGVRLGGVLQGCGA